VSLFVALAPSILFEYSTEDTYQQLSKLDWLQDLVITMSYLEFDGKDREKDTDFLGYLKVNYPLVCLAYDDICSMGTLTKEKLDSSPSVDICRSDEERLEIYLAMTGGTSTKNLIHMAQLY